MDYAVRIYHLNEYLIQHKKYTLADGLSLPTVWNCWMRNCINHFRATAWSLSSWEPR